MLVLASEVAVDRMAMERQRNRRMVAISIGFGRVYSSSSAIKLEDNVERDLKLNEGLFQGIWSRKWNICMMVHKELG